MGDVYILKMTEKVVWGIHRYIIFTLYLLYVNYKQFLRQQVLNKNLIYTV